MCVCAVCAVWMWVAMDVCLPVNVCVYPVALTHLVHQLAEERSTPNSKRKKVKKKKKWREYKTVSAYQRNRISSKRRRKVKLILLLLLTL